MAANRNVHFKIAAIASLLLASAAVGYCSESEAARSRYQACVNSAEAAHQESQAAACKSLVEKAERDRTNCLYKLKLPKIYCEASYPSRDRAPMCILPEQIASVLDAELQQARYRCQREFEAAHWAARTSDRASN